MMPSGLKLFENLAPVILAIILLGAGLGGSLLKPAARKLIEKYFLRPVFIVVIAGLLYWAIHEGWRDIVAHHPGAQIFLHVGLTAVLAWLLVDTVRKTIRAYREPPAQPPAETAP